MKIGILSMQRVINYGSFLQAYALKHTLENLGHEVSFVDIKKGRQLDQSVTKTIPRNKVKISELPRRIEHVLFFFF